MQHYNCVVRLGGRVTAEVSKEDVPATEIIMYRAIHGSDAVRAIQKVGNANRRHTDERARLAYMFGEKKVTAVFGPAFVGSKLPANIDAIGAIPDLSGEEGPAMIENLPAVQNASI